MIDGAELGREATLRVSGGQNPRLSGGGMLF
jgi:hypothetical protein